MKVIVGYTGYVEKEIEIDDAFAPCADPYFNDMRILDDFTEEVLDKFRRQVEDYDYDEICYIMNENKKCLVAL